MIYIYVFIKSLINLYRNSVRFENFSGNRLSDRLNSVILSHSVRYGMYENGSLFHYGHRNPDSSVG